MTITIDQIHALARLAHFDLSPEQASQLAQEISDMLGVLQQVQTVETTGVSPMYTPVEQPERLRADEVHQDFSRAQILANAPETDGKHFIVPRIM